MEINHNEWHGCKFIEQVNHSESLIAFYGWSDLSDSKPLNSTVAIWKINYKPGFPVNNFPDDLPF